MAAEAAARQGQRESTTGRWTGGKVMSWLQGLGGILQQYMGASPQQAGPEAEGHFDQVAQNAPPQALASGLASAFRSDQTPPFGQMVSQLFGQSQPQQQAGLLNTLMGAVGPQLASQVLGGSGLAGIDRKSVV